MKVLILEDPPEQIIEYLKNFQVVQPKVEEVTREGFAKLLEQKGYRAKAPETIQKFCQMYNITPTRKGKYFMYPVSQIEKIPNKY